MIVFDLVTKLFFTSAQLTNIAIAKKSLNLFSYCCTVSQITRSFCADLLSGVSKNPLQKFTYMYYVGVCKFLYISSMCTYYTRVHCTGKYNAIRRLQTGYRVVVRHGAGVWTFAHDDTGGAGRCGSRASCVAEKHSRARDYVCAQLL